jgi:hypothetical protein
MDFFLSSTPPHRSLPSPKQELREIFSRYDKDHSGELDIDEFVSVVLDFGYRLHRLHHPSISSRPASMDNLAVVKPGNEVGPEERGSLGGGG